jgi:hypothetical protein
MRCEMATQRIESFKPSVPLIETMLSANIARAITKLLQSQKIDHRIIVGRHRSILETDDQRYTESVTKETATSPDYTPPYYSEQVVILIRPSPGKPLESNRKGSAAGPIL